MKKILILLVALIFVAVGCAPKAVQTTPPATSVTDRSLSDKDKDRTGISEEELAKAERDRLLREQERLAGILKDVHFDFDSYAVNSSELSKIEGVGSFMKGDRSVRIVIEGHCDERGTVDYNLALGQKRAEAVKAYLLKLGIESSRIRTISYGKELPAIGYRADPARYPMARSFPPIQAKPRKPGQGTGGPISNSIRRGEHFL